MSIYKRRVVISGVGAVWSAGTVTVPDLVFPGTIRAVKATANAADDPGGFATVGTTGATDIALRLADADGDDVLAYGLTPAHPDLTIESQEYRAFQSSLTFYVRLDQDLGGLSDAAVSIDVWIDSES